MSFECAYSDIIGKWKFPTKIKTYIPQNNKRTVMMKHAFAEWSRLTNNKIIFVYTQDKTKAQVEVQFLKLIPNAERAIGLTRTKAYGKTMAHATIQIAEKSVDGRTLTNDNVYTVMLHEIGHAIGLNHSSNILSIMFPTEDDRQEIRKSDLKTLSELYGWK